MKIVFATGIFPPEIGGPATYVAKLADNLKSSGFDVSVVTYSNEKDKEYGFLVKRISKKYPKGIRHLLYFFFLFKLALNADVIYSQNVTSAGFPSLLVSVLLRKKMALKVVGDYAWEEALRKRLTDDLLDDFQNRKYGFYIEILRKIQRMVARRANIIITPSYYLKGILQKWGISSDKIEVVYNAPELMSLADITKEFAKQKIGVDGDILLSVGRLSPWKGFKALINTMSLLIKKNPNLKLLIVGEGEEKNNLKKEIKKLNLENNIIMTGSVPHEKMPVYYKAADIFILNSSYEGLSHVVLEAMQQELPLVVSNCGGNPELVKDDFNGFLISYNNQQEIKEAVLKILSNPDLRNKFIKNSKDKLSEFTWNNLFNKTSKILSDL